MMRCAIFVIVVAATFVPIKISAETKVTPPPITVKSDYECLKFGNIDPYEIRKVGNKNGSAPSIKLSGLALQEAWEGKVYVEINSEMLSAADSRFVELYANVGEEFDDCKAGGTLITNEVDGLEYNIGTVAYPYNDEYKPEDQDDCFPRSTESVVIEIGFTFDDPFYDKPEAMKIYDPQGGKDTNDGRINVCVRIGYKYKHEIDGIESEELISFLDTKIGVNVDVTADFNVNDLSLTNEQATEFEYNIECSIDVIMFLCGTKGVNNGSPIGESYGLGQTFRLCVDVTDEYKDDYKLTGFESVTCGNEPKTIELVVNGDSDALTMVKKKVKGSHNVGGTLTASANAVAVVSVVTSEYFTGDSSFNCRGEVQLKYIGLEGGGKCENSRHLNTQPQEQSASTVKQYVPFVTTIKLSTTDNDDSTAAATASYHHRTVIDATINVVGIGFVLLCL